MRFCRTLSFQNNLKKLFYGTLFILCSFRAESQVQAVSHIDLRQIIGTWYTIAYIPGRLPKDCFSAKAEYKQNLIEGKKEQLIGKFICKKWGDGDWETETLENAIRLPKEAGGKQWWTGTPVDGDLQMDPAWYAPKWVPYWILDLGPSFLVIGGPKKTILVIYSKTPTLPAEMYQQIINKLKIQGYENVEERLVTLQPWYR